MFKGRVAIPNGWSGYCKTQMIV